MGTDYEVEMVEVYYQMEVLEADLMSRGGGGIL